MCIRDSNNTEIVLARNEHFTEQRLVQCKYFEVFKYEVTDEVKIAVDEASFVSVLFISGKGSIETDDYDFNQLNIKPKPIDLDIDNYKEHNAFFQRLKTPLYKESAMQNI